MGTTTDDSANQVEESAARQTSGTPRYTRRLSDKILIAFHHACDQSELHLAASAAKANGGYTTGTRYSAADETER